MSPLRTRRRQLAWFTISLTGIVVFATLLVIQVKRTRDEVLLAPRILMGCADAIVACSEDGQVLVFNPAAEELTGYTAAEIKAGGIGLIMPEEYIARHVEAMGEAVDRLRASADGWTPPFRAKVQIVRKDGSKFEARLSVSGAMNRNRILFVAMFRAADAEGWPNLTDELRRIRPGSIVTFAKHSEGQ